MPRLLHLPSIRPNLMDDGLTAFTLLCVHQEECRLQVVVTDDAGASVELRVDTDSSYIPQVGYCPKSLSGKGFQGFVKISNIRLLAKQRHLAKSLQCLAYRHLSCLGNQIAWTIHALNVLSQKAPETAAQQCFQKSVLPEECRIVTLLIMVRC